MSLREWFRPPRQVLTMFVAAAVVSVGVLGVLSWQLMDQDRTLATQHERERLDQAADRAIASMQRALADLQALVGTTTATSSPLPAGVVAMSVTGARVITRPDRALLYDPFVPVEPLLRAAVFQDGDRLEFVTKDLAGAAAAYAALSRSADLRVRAEALVRLARVHRQRGAAEQAEQAYAALDGLDATTVDGLPAALIARAGRLGLYGEAGHVDARTREAAALLQDLQQRRWQSRKPSMRAIRPKRGSGWRGR